LSRRFNNDSTSGNFENYQKVLVNVVHQIF